MSAGGPRSAHEAVIGCDPLGRPNPDLVVALARAGALGVLDLTGGPGDHDRLTDVAARVTVPFAVRLRRRLPLWHGDLPAAVGAVIVPPDGELGDLERFGDRRVLVTVTSADEAHKARQAGAAGLVACGSEAGGRVGDLEAFVLLQQLAGCGLPVWLRGGIGVHTAAAAVAAGASGVVLDTQLALVSEAGLDDATKHALRAMDGSETRLVGGHRVYTRPDLPAARLAPDTPEDEVAARLGPDIAHDLLPVGQEGAFAAGFAERYATAGGVVTAVRRAIAEQVDAARSLHPLGAGNGVARSHGTRLPVVQGPMTRVSDQAGFARAVADAGGLPFLALAVMGGREVRALLEETAELLGDRPWGVGVLGFVPPELREEQLREIRAVQPPAALIAGGRPSQAAALEQDGIPTYIHAPSPGLLDSFLAAGARRFVFEGRECGGHVGPRSSFVLWETAVQRLLEVDDPEALDLLFAGGVHDDVSAAAVAVLTAPLVERGARVGVLMGTSYLFTEEAVAHGAITWVFQREALACQRTVLLETSPGHVTRCAGTPYADTFARARGRLEERGATNEEMWAELEDLNLGRLRVASKALVREGEELRPVDAREVHSDGMFMLGQAAVLRDECTTLQALHDSVTAGATSLLAEGDVQHRAETARLDVREPPPRLDVAIVGMSAIMPGAHDVEELWANIVAGVDSVTEVPAERWDPERYYDPAATGTGAGRHTPSKWGGFVPRVGFDALAFGIPPASLASVEPVQLLALEVAARALDDAGYGTRDFNRSRASVIFGAEAGTDLSSAYNLRTTLPAYLPPDASGQARLPDSLETHLPRLTEDSFPGVLANVIAGRIANRLDLGGVNYTVDAACAASLAALDLACKELVGGSSDLVLCGGADLHNSINDFLLFASVHALSPSGRCRTFDAEADGIALGEGVACLVLKRLADARRDGDRVYAVVEAVGGSSDGKALGLTAPRADGQQRALERAYSQARRSPAGIELVEAHGTGTVVGDGTELATLTELFAGHGSEPQSCSLGSVKSQIGHTKCTAGLAGLIKVARSLYHGVLPPTVGIEQPNPGYDENKSPFRFNQAARPWASPDRRAGVSAFGFGGTNFHAVLSSSDSAPAHGARDWPAELFLIRAADRDEASARLTDLARLVDEIVETDPDGARHRLGDLARTVGESGTGPVQVALVADDFAHLGRQLAAATEADTDAGAARRLEDAGRVHRVSGMFERSDLVTGDVAFLFPGQGSQRLDMLADLFVAFPRLHRHLRDGAAWAHYIYPPRAFSADARERQRLALTDTRVAQPSLGVVELALADLLGQVGIRPAATAGHSYGELMALAAAGALDPRPLLTLSAARGAAVHDAAATAADPGAMAAVAAPENVVAGYLARRNGALVLANHNAPRQCVIAGPTDEVDALVEELRAEGVSSKRLPVACAFHSSIVADAREPLAARLAKLIRRPPTLPVWSNTSTAPYPADPAAIAELLADQVTRPVRFVEQIEAMYAAGNRIFVEAGPGRVLTGLVRDILGDRPHLAVACDVDGEHGVRRFLLALAELATHGVDLDPAVLFADRTERLDLATLPRPAPGWTVDGHLVRTADGQPVAGGLQPATTAPVLDLDEANALPARMNGSRDPGDVVTDYLQTLRDTVAAEREVLLRYLDSTALPGRPRLPSGTSGTSDQAATSAEPHEPVPTESAAPARPALGRDDLHKTLVAIVADRTGYPPEMLEGQLDLEADLSIDSIKRLEIIGEVVEQVKIPATTGADPAGGIDETVVEELAQIKTLDGIVDWLLAATEPLSEEAEPGGDTAEPGRSTEDGTVPQQALRCIVEAVDAPPPGPAPTPSPFAGTTVAISDDGSGVAAELSTRLAALQASTEIIDPAAGSNGDGDGSATSAVAIAASADVLIHLALDQTGDARAAFTTLAPAATNGARWLACVTPVSLPVDGVRPTGGGEGGLMRALGRERPDQIVRHVEVDPTSSPGAIADLVVTELSQAGPVGVLHADGRRLTRQVVATERRTSPPPVFDDGAVVLLTGGARGITAHFARAFAEAGAGHIELVGRSALPGDTEPADLAEADDLRSLRTALLARDEKLAPAEIEARCRQVLAEREMRETLHTLAAAGADVRYHPVDVRDPDALRAVVTDIYRRHGRLDGVVHGAGIVEDRLLADKTPESFRRVYETKVLGARTLLEVVRDDVGFVVLFGSVAGVFGNRGQVDYAAANDALDALAHAAAFGRLAGRVLSIDWGPWGGPGMVSEELAREYARRGVGLIEPDDGVAALWEELASRNHDSRFPQPQVVVLRARPELFTGGDSG